MTEKTLGRAERDTTDMVSLSIGSTNDIAIVPSGMTLLFVACQETATTGTSGYLTPCYSVDHGETFMAIDVDLEGRTYPETVLSGSLPTSPKTFRLPPTGTSGGASGYPVQFKMVPSASITGHAVWVSAKEG